MIQEFQQKQTRTHPITLDGVMKQSDTKFHRYFSFHWNTITSRNTELTSNYKIKKLSDELIKKMKIHNWKSFQKISLNFRRCEQIDDRGLVNIAKKIGNYLPDLEELHFDFSYCSLITDNGLNLFGCHLAKNLKKLLKFEINLFGCVNLTDKGSNLFASHFGKNLSKLKSLNIKIGCTKFSDNVLAKIGKIISTRLQTFDSLAVDLSFCNQITSEGLAKLGSAITQRSIPLQNLFVNFNT